MMTAKQAVDKLLSAAYDAGFYSSYGDLGQPRHQKAIEERDALYGLVMAHLEHKDAQLALAKSEVALWAPTEGDAE